MNGRVPESAGRAVLGAIVALVACGGEAPFESIQSLDQVLIWEEVIALEETEEAINVSPNFSFDSEGGFLVADGSEQQFRHYDPSGHLLGAYGKNGDGPGEFGQPAAAAELHGGDLLAVDWDGRYTRFRPDGGMVAAGRFPVYGITDLLVISEAVILLAGRLQSNAGEEHLHILDLSSGQVVRSFFEPPPREPSSSLRVCELGSQFAAVYGLSDSLYVFDRDGRDEGRYQLPGPYFRPYADPLDWPPPPEWFRSFTWAWDVYCLSDESVLVQYYEAREAGGPAFHLSRLDTHGAFSFEILNTPRLVAVSSDGRKLAFLDPEAEAPNRLRIARWALQE